MKQIYKDGLKYTISEHVQSVAVATDKEQVSRYHSSI